MISFNLQKNVNYAIIFLVFRGVNMINEERILNRGIPSLKDISISANLLAENCAYDSGDLFEQLKNDFISLLDGISKYYNYPYYFTTELLEFSLDENLNTHLCFNKDMAFLNSIQLLNCPEVLEFNNDDEVNKYVKDIIRKLKNTRTRELFKNNFPALYDEFDVLESMSKEYKTINAQLSQLLKLKDIIIKREDYDKLLERKKTIDDYFKRFGFDPKGNINFLTFIDYNCKLFNKLFLREGHYDIMEYISSACLDIGTYDKLLDEDKLELLLACSHLSTAFGREKYRTENFSYVTSYFDDVKDKIDDDISIVMSMNDGEEQRKEGIITRRDLYKYYKRFLNLHPEIEIIHANKNDFDGKSLDDIEEYINKYKNDIEVSWEILPTSDLASMNYDRLGNGSLSDEDKQKLEESKERIFDEKSEFYQSHEPYRIIKGKNSFNGYIGFIYPNGKVILDQYYEINSNRIATSAIYVMEIDEFIELSRKSKTEIIEGKLCPRIIHKNGWESKVENFIEGEVTPETLEDVQTAVKRLQYTK